MDSEARHPTPDEIRATLNEVARDRPARGWASPDAGSDGPRGAEGGGSALRDYLAILRLRWWLVLLTAALVPAVAVAFSLQQKPLYQASADVLVKSRNLATTISGIPEPYTDPDRLMQTQVDIATIPEVAGRVLAAVGLKRPPESFLSRSTVVPKTTSDVLTFSVTDGDPTLAVRLATEYARQYTIYRQELDTETVRSALVEVEQRLEEIGVPRDRESPLYQSYASLVERREQLRTFEALQTSNASLVRPATSATKTQPKPVRNGIVGLGLGLVFGVALAFLWHALDTRVRTVEEIRERLRLPLLARLPEPPRRRRRKNQLAMLVEPHGISAEAFRMLRTNLEFTNLERGARTIMFSSAHEGEGKSTTIANLAVALARGGKRVVVVDLDLRRPSLDVLFGLGPEWGLTDVALGHVTLEQAVRSITLVGEPAATDTNGRGSPVEGTVEVLASGPVPPDPGEFVGTRALDQILAELAGRADLVLIDAPPLLHVSDALVLGGKVDALVLVTRLSAIRRRTLGELHRVLDTCRAVKLGFVVTGTGDGDGYGRQAYYYKAGTDARERQTVG